MNKKYIDFIPAKKVRRPVETSVRTVVAERVERTDFVGPSAKGEQTFGVTEDFSARFVKTEVMKRPLSGAEMMGQGRNIDAYKRGVGNLHENRSADEATLRALKAKKIGQKERNSRRGAKASAACAMEPLGVIEDNVGASNANMAGAVNGAVGAGNRVTRAVYSVPKSPFINQADLPKRPLSRNVYQKQVDPTLGKQNNIPVKVVPQEKRESKVGMVIGVIVTIILGAVAGYVAFCFLPK